MNPSCALSFRALALALFTSTLLFGDTVDTKDGSRIVGKVLTINAGVVTLDTVSAGKISVKQSEVVALTTDQPIAVRLASGTRLDGRISAATGRAVPGAGGALQIIGSDGTVTTTVDQVAASWAAGHPDPAYERHWAYEASVDVSGKTGNSEQLGTTGDFRATLRSSQDTLLFYAAYNRQVANGTKAADQLKIGIDYQNNFAGRNAWYVRDEGGFDRVKGIQVYDIAAAGYGFNVFNEPLHTLTGRLGLAYRYEGYKNPATRNVSSAGLDVGLNHELKFTESKLVNRISYVPLFDDFSNFRLFHESYYEIPLTKPAWKLRLGVANDYNSKPPPRVERLDTAYFTRLVLNWR